MLEGEGEFGGWGVERGGRGSAVVAVVAARGAVF